jgi:hypothetical protein
MRKRVTAQHFDRMADGVSEIENLPNATFVLIPGNYARFDLYATDDDAGQRVTRFTPSIQYPGYGTDNGIKVTPIRYRAMFERFGKSRSQFSKWKCRKKLRVNENP